MPHLPKGLRPALIALSILLLAATGLYGAGALYIKRAGITVRPAAIYAPKPVGVFLQNDPRWSGNHLGASPYRLGGSGCLVSVLASALNDMEYDTDPERLNRLFSERGVYNEEGEVIWYKIAEAIPGVRYHYTRIFCSRTLENDLAHGRLPIVMVRYHGSGVFHWVLIAGSDGHDFLIVDPLKQDRQLTTLGTHGKVYAYRVLVKSRVAPK